MADRISTRDRLIDAATSLFATGGYHAIGVSRILEEAGVSRVGLYHHFRSKEELILAVLRRRDEVTRNLIMREVEQASHQPAERLLALFAFLERYVGQPDFTGCMFLNAAAEYHDENHPIHRMATEHKRMMLSFIEKQCGLLGADDPHLLAHQIYMLFDGAIVQIHAAGDAAKRTEAAREATAALLSAAVPAQ